MKPHYKLAWPSTERLTNWAALLERRHWIGSAGIRHLSHGIAILCLPFFFVTSAAEARKGGARKEEGNESLCCRATRGGDGVRLRGDDGVPRRGWRRATDCPPQACFGLTSADLASGKEASVGARRRCRRIAPS